MTGESLLSWKGLSSPSCMMLVMKGAGDPWKSFCRIGPLSMPCALRPFRFPLLLPLSLNG